MKASALIELLQKAISEHGDLQVASLKDFLDPIESVEYLANLPEHCEWQRDGGFEPPLLAI